MEKKRKNCSDSDDASAATDDETAANGRKSRKSNLSTRRSRRDVEESEDDSESEESEEDDESDSESEDFDSPESDSEESQDDLNDGFDENVICAIPTPIPLPPMDSALRQAIKEGRLRDKSVKSRLVRISVDFYMSMKRYPSKEDYNNICGALIAAYPDLRDPLEIPGYPPFTQLKKKLIERMCHLRRARVTTKRKRSPERLDPSWILDAKFAEGPAFPCQAPPPPPPATSRLPGFIPTPAPLPRFSADLRGVLGLGVPLVSKVRCKFLLACAEFYLGLKYHPTNDDFNNICKSLVDAFPKLADPGSYAGNLCFNNLKKDLSCYFCKFRRRHSQDKNRGDVGAGSWVDTLVLLEKVGAQGQS